MFESSSRRIMSPEPRTMTAQEIQMIGRYLPVREIIMPPITDVSEAPSE